MIFKLIIKFVVRLTKCLPEKIRYRIFRNRVEVPAFAMDPNFSIGIARNQSDLESSYGLLHDCYVATKLMTPHFSGLRCNLFTFLPHSTVIVAKYNGKTVGTVSLIRDSSWGLPSDKDYKIENDKLRRAGQKLVEVSALAVSKEFRNSGNAVSLLLMKYLYNYTFHFLSSSCLVCTVHPRAEDFYRALWHFERNGKIVQYQFVQGALAVHLSLEISYEKMEMAKSSYRSQELKKNLVLFVLAKDSRFHYPIRKLGAQIDPVLTPELFEYFCVQKTHVWHTLSAAEKNSLYSVYKSLFGYCNRVLLADSNITDLTSRDYRIPVEIIAMLQENGHCRIVKITDLSEGGAFIAWPKDLTDPSSQVMITFKMGNSIIRMNGEIAWKNNGKSYLQPYGFGVKFPAAKKVVGTGLKNWLCSVAS